MGEITDMLLQISSFIPAVKDRYYISDNGELFTDFGERKLRDGIKGGYIKNQLVHKDGTSKQYFRHRLVMLCFCPNEKSDNLQVNHKNGDKLDNRLSNLEWCTNQENRIHAVKLGLAARLVGEDNPFSKLREEEVLDIVTDLLNHVPYSNIMQKHNCSKSTISAIKNKRNWTYLTQNIDF